MIEEPILLNSAVARHLLIYFPLIVLRLSATGSTSLEKILDRADWVCGQSNPSDTVFFADDDQLFAYRSGSVVSLGPFESFAVFRQSGDRLFRGELMGGDTLQIYHANGKTEEIPLPDASPVWTVNATEETIYTGVADRSELLVRALRNNGELIAEHRFAFEHTAHANTKGQLFSSFGENVWMVWNPASRELFEFDRSLNLLRRFPSPLPSIVEDFDPAIVSALITAEGSGDAELLKELCREHHGKPLSMLVTGFGYTGTSYFTTYRVSILDGCIRPGEADLRSVSWLTEVDEKHLNKKYEEALNGVFILGLCYTSDSILTRTTRQANQYAEPVHRFSLKRYSNLQGETP
jgi:hypothetical protein